MANSTAPTPRTPQELAATSARYRSRAKGMRALLADPGDGIEDFKEHGPAQAEFCEQLADALDAVAAE